MEVSFTINCKGQLIALSSPKVMGILNLTPDSFYDGGKFRDLKGILTQVERMLKEGATFIDLGGYSSRPNAAEVTEIAERQRVIPVVTHLLKEFPNILLSIDTFRSTIADEAISAGAAMINDISAGALDTNMFSIVAKHNVPYIAMHMKGTPQVMQEKAQYTHLLNEVLFYFSEKIEKLRVLGVNDIIIDPGFGFAKTLHQNYELLQNLALLESLQLPITVGLSRKSMIYNVLKTTPDAALNGTTALHMYALQQGAHILRAHDVKEAKECIALWQQLQ